MGDYLCYLSENSHRLFQALRSQGFQQIVKAPTSLKGRLIDLAFISSANPSVYYEARQQSQFFTDHDLIEIMEGKLTLFQPEQEMYCLILLGYEESC